MNNKKQRIPTVMYHSIGIVNRKWHWNFLTCPYKVFEDQLKWLKKMGYNTVNFQEVYDHIMNDKPIPKKAVFLNFDDGYLDNYVFAYPLLKKYGMKGTVFVNPDFVDKSNELRPNLDDVAAKEIDELKVDGFCNWAELKKMDEEGVIDVQSHAKTHTWYPISDKIIDFRKPGDDYIWMDWNSRPNEKDQLQYIDWNKVNLGEAIFEHEKALTSKRVFINQDFQEELNRFVMTNGGASFFDQSDWRDKLNSVSDDLRLKHKVIVGEETYDDYLNRVRHELEFSKTEIEKNVGKEVHFICWPGGSGTKDSLKISTDLGYLMSTAAGDLTNEERKKITNSPDNKLNRIARFTPVMFNSWSKDDENSVIKYSPGYFFVLQIMRFKNTYFAKFWMKYLGYAIVKLNKFNV